MHLKLRGAPSIYFVVHSNMYALYISAVYPWVDDAVVGRPPLDEEPPAGHIKGVSQHEIHGYSVICEWSLPLFRIQLISYLAGLAYAILLSRCFLPVRNSPPTIYI